MHYSEGVIASGAADDAMCLFVENKDHSVLVLHLFLYHILYVPNFQSFIFDLQHNVAPQTVTHATR